MARPPTRGAPRAAASIGQKIRQVREARGLSQGALAEALGVTQTAVSYWESGRRSPDVDDLIEIADVLETDVAALFADTRPRKRAPVVMRAVAERVLLDEFADQVDQFTAAIESTPAPDARVRVESGNPMTAAGELLAAAGIVKPPVPVAELAALCGVRVAGGDFDSAISGFFLDLESGPTVGYNQKHAPRRQRFTIAHELGHYVLRHHDHFHLDLASPAQQGTPPGYDWRDERSANEFAAELLMPAKLVIAAHGRHKDTRLPQLFDVSQEAMGFRLVNLGLR